MYFADISYLALLLPVFVIMYISVRRSRLIGMSLAWLILAFSAVIALVVALAEPYYYSSEDCNVRDIVLIDVSRSISPEALAKAGELIPGYLIDNQSASEISYFCFARELVPITEQNIHSLADAREDNTGVFTNSSPDFFDSTDIKKALLSVLAKFKGDIRVWLYSDCHETVGDIDSLCPALGECDIWLIPLLPEISYAREVILKQAEIDNNLRSGSVANISLAIESNFVGEVQVNIKSTDMSVMQTFIAVLEPGINYLSLPVMIVSLPGEYFKAVVEIASEDDGYPDNNQRLVSAKVGFLPRILLAGGSDDYIDKLRAIFDGAATVARFNSDADLQNADLLIVSNNSSELLLPDWQRVADRVSEGMGFLMLPSGGRASLEQQPWAGVQELFPVTLVHDSKRENPDTAVVFIVDTSGSMSNEQLALSREVIRQSLLRLGDNDYVGIIEFYSTKKWAAILQNASNYIEINRAINRLTPGGGTVLTPSIEEAHYALLNNDAAIKHVVIITDGGVGKADYERVIDKISQDNISLSTILVGPATHVGFLAEMARWGNGRLFHIRDRLFIPAINFKEKFSQSASAQVDSISEIYPTFSYRFLNGIDIDALDKDMDYIKVALRSSAQSVLDISHGGSLLSYWNYGAGISAFSSSNMFWRNLSDPETANLLQQLCLWLCPLDTSLYQGSDEAQSQAAIEESVAYNMPFEKPGLNNNILLANRLSSANKADIDAVRSKSVAIDISNWFVVLSLVCFVLSVVVRRLPGIAGSVKKAGLSGRLMLLVFILTSSQISEAAESYIDLRCIENISAALDGSGQSLDYELFDDSVDENILSFVFGDYEKVMVSEDCDFSGKMLVALAYYSQEQFLAAYEHFFDSALNAPDSLSRKYAFAWSVLAAERCSRTESLIDYTCNAPDFAIDCIDPLVFLLAGKHSRTSLLKLYDSIANWQNPDRQNQGREEEKIIQSLLSFNSLAEIGVELTRYNSYNLARSVLHNLLSSDGKAEIERVVPVLIANMDSPGELLQFARLLGEEYPFYNLASLVLDKAKVLADDPEVSFNTNILQLRLLARRNDKDSAIVLLNRMITTNELSTTHLLQLAKEFESLGDIEKVKEILEIIYRQNDSIDDMIRFVQFARNYIEPDRLYEFWLGIWQKCDQEYLLYSVEPELLNVAGLTGNMVRLMFFLEKQVKDNIDRDKSILLLVTIYESFGDPTGIVALVEQYYGSDTIESLLVQNRIYFRTRQYSFCIRILDKLLTIDPENTSKYLYQITMMALESNDPARSYQAIQMIERLAPQDASSYEFVAGMHLLLDDQEGAMEYYQLALHSSQSTDSTWLSWAQTADRVGKGDIAVKKLMEIITSDCSDNLLCTAVDALVEIDADDIVIRQVLSNIIYRIASQPKKIFLYQLALDLIDDLGIRSALAYRLRLLVASVSPENRRLLFCDFGNQLQPEAVFVSEHTLIMPLLLGYYIPYSSLIHIADNLLRGNSSTMKDYFLTSYIIPQVQESDLTRLVEYFQRKGLFSDVTDILARARALHIDNIPILIANAEHNEIIGNYKLAFSDYFDAYSRLLRSTSYDFASENINRLYSFNSEIRNRSVVLDGMLDTCRDDDIVMVVDFLESLLAELNISTGLVKHDIDMILSLWLDYDRLALAGGLVELSDNMRNTLAKNCSPELAFYRLLLKNRVDYGYLPEYVLSDSELNVSIAIGLLESGQYHGGNAASVTLDIISGINEQSFESATELISLAARQLHITDLDTCFDLLAASAILNRSDLVPDIVLNFTRNYIISQPKATHASTLRVICSSVSKLLTPSEALALATVLESYFVDNPEVCHCLELLSVDINSGRFYSPDVAELLIHSGPSYSVLAEMVQYSNPQQRLVIFSKALSSVEIAKQGQYVMGFFRSLDYVVSESELEGYCRSIDNLASINFSNNAYQYLVKFADEASLNFPLVKYFSARGLQLYPESLEFRAFHILALAASGEYSNASLQAVGLLDNMAGISEIEAEFCFIVRDMAGLLSPECIEQYLDKLTVIERKQLLPTQQIIFSELAFRIGNLSLAEQLITDCFEQVPDNRAVMNFATERLPAMGRVGQMIRLLSDYLKHNPENTYYWRSLFKLACDSGDFAVAKRALDFDQTAMYDLNSVYLAYISGDYQKLRQLLRLAVIHCRREQNYYSFIWRNWQNPGGILQFLEQQNSSRSMYQALADSQELRPELARYFRNMPRTGSYYNDFASGLSTEPTTNGQQTFWLLVRALITESVFDLSLLDEFVFNNSQTETLTRIIMKDYYGVFNQKKTALFLAVLAKIDDDGSQRYIDKMRLSQRTISPILAAELLKYYLADNNWPEFKKVFDQLLSKSYFKLNQPVYANLLKLASVNNNSINILNYAIERVSSFDGQNIDTQATVAYLAMLAVVQYEMNMPTAKTIDQIENLVKDYPDQQLWLLDALEMCQYKQRADKLIDDMQLNHTLPFCRNPLRQDL